jgi:cytochrome P450
MAVLHFTAAPPTRSSSKRILTTNGDSCTDERQGGNLLLGQVFNQAKALPSEIEKSWMRANPDIPFIRYLSFLNTEFLMVNNLRAHKEVLQTHCYSFIKPGYYERVVAEIAGRGILFMEGEEHRKQRKLLVGM